MHLLSMNSMKKWCLAGALGLSAALVTEASAEIVYGDFAGSTLDFINVKEDDTGLFSTPTVSGDSLVFNPIDFEAQSSGGGIDLVDGTLAFLVMAKPGEAIDTLAIEEGGFYSLQGVGGAGTQVLVALGATVQVLEVDNAPFDGPLALMNFGSQFLSEDLTGGTAILQSWQGQASYDLATAAESQLGITGDITKVAVTIDNQLIAISEDGSVSYVDKKGFRSIIVTVPEPGSMMLIGLGSAAMLARRRVAG